MKRILLTALLTLSCLSLPAQSIFQAPGRVRSLTEENQQLRSQVDSLLARVDSLRQERLEEEIAFLEGNSDYEDEEGNEYTAELTDSLLGVWYETRRISDYVEGEIYDMDSVTFTSKLSDEELIARIEAMHPYITVPFNETVKNYIVMYSEKMKERMGRILGRSSYYMPIFEEVFSRYGLPLELKYMAVIESMLDPVATSRAGARGMWQFMYTTAKVYGLKINSFVDERLDVEKAVDAAARFLRDSYEVFGDWNLAISAYNCGAGNVNKAIRRSGGKRDFWSIYPYLPRETRGYVPAFVGAMYAMYYYKDYGIVPSDFPVPAVDTFEIDRNLHFKQITGLVGIPMEELKELNPQYLHDIIPGSEGTCILKVPYNWTNALLDVPMDSLYAYMADSLISPQVIKNIQVSSNETRTAYKVKNGDYLGRIATRYHVTVAQLKSWNNLRSNNIRVGQILYIYHNGTVPAASSASSSASSAAPAASAPATATNPDDYAGYQFYTVQAGDTFYSIAKNYPGISAQNIMDYNNMSSSKLQPGMKIKIPVLK